MVSIMDWRLMNHIVVVLIVGTSFSSGQLLSTTPSVVDEASANSVEVAFYGIYLSEWNDQNLEWLFRGAAAYETNSYCALNMDKCGVTMNENSTATGFKDSDVIFAAGYPMGKGNKVLVKFYVRYPTDVTLQQTPITRHILNKDALFWSMDKESTRSLLARWTTYPVVAVDDAHYFPPPKHFWNIIFIPVTVLILLCFIAIAVGCHFWKVKRSRQERREKRQRRKEKKEQRAKLLNSSLEDGASDTYGKNSKNRISPHADAETSHRLNGHTPRMRTDDERLFVVEDERTVPHKLQPQVQPELTSTPRLAPLPPPSVRKDQKKDKKKKKKKKHHHKKNQDGDDTEGVYDNPVYDSEATLGNTYEIPVTLGSHQPMNSTMRSDVPSQRNNEIYVNTSVETTKQLVPSTEM